MWGVTPSKLWDWDILRAKIENHGVRNSLLVSPMPTASTAQILGNNEVNTSSDSIDKLKIRQKIVILYKKNVKAKKM